MVEDGGVNRVRIRAAVNGDSLRGLLGSWPGNKNATQTHNRITRTTDPPLDPFYRPTAGIFTTCLDEPIQLTQRNSPPVIGAEVADVNRPSPVPGRSECEAHKLGRGVPLRHRHPEVH